MSQVAVGPKQVPRAASSAASLKSGIASAHSAPVGTSAQQLRPRRERLRGRAGALPPRRSAGGSSRPAAHAAGRARRRRRCRRRGRRGPPRRPRRGARGPRAAACCPTGARTRSASQEAATRPGLQRTTEAQVARRQYARAVSSTPGVRRDGSVLARVGGDGRVGGAAVGAGAGAVFGGGDGATGARREAQECEREGAHGEGSGRVARRASASKSAHSSPIGCACPGWRARYNAAARPETLRRARG